MTQKEIELILTRQLASYLAMPMVVVDTNGDLLFFNEPAEQIFGRRFDETEGIRRGEWSQIFQPQREDGTPVPRDEQPLFIATEEGKPAYARFWIRALDGENREIEGTALPLIGQSGRMLGAVGIFWEIHAGNGAP